MLIALYSPKGTYDSTFLANYAYINLNDELTRVPGVARVQIFGAGQYAMRVWVKPDQLAKLRITVPRDHQRGPDAEHRQSRRPDRRRARAAPGRNSHTPSAPRDGSSPPRSSAASSCARIPTARSCA